MEEISNTTTIQTTIYDRFRSDEEAEEEIRSIMWQHDLDVLDAMLFYAEKNSLEIDSLVTRVSPALKKDLEVFCETRNMLKSKKKRLNLTHL